MDLFFHVFFSWKHKLYQITGPITTILTNYLYKSKVVRIFFTNIMVNWGLEIIENPLYQKNSIQCNVDFRPRHRQFTLFDIMFGALYNAALLKSAKISAFRETNPSVIIFDFQAIYQALPPPSSWEAILWGKITCRML